MIKLPTPPARPAMLARLATEAFDVLIIGGGATGAGLALDAAARGFRTALVEKRDFAAGTSSRSTKLIHGGLRYLEHFDFTLVHEALRERATLGRIAPHLARPFPFLIPIYRDARRNYDRPWKMRAGLVLYDLLAGRQEFARHRRVTRDQALQLAPGLDPNGLQGAFIYQDGVTEDARLVIENIKAAVARGACAANYARVVELAEDEVGQLKGARCRDEVTGAEFAVQARVVINATGVWLEDTFRLDRRTRHALGKSVRPAKGIHLTIAAERLPVTAACLIPSLTGHRFYFVVPWQGRINIGTTDTDYTGGNDAPAAERCEADEILEAINTYFPNAALTPADVISAWAGLRPLISDPQARDTTAVSRKEEIFASANGLISVGGGKLTTYRLMAERGIDLAARRLNQRVPSTTGQISLGALTAEEVEQAKQRLITEEHLAPETAGHLVNNYGAHYAELIELMREEEALRAPLIAGLPHVAAEIVYATRYELALTLADALARRTRLAMLAGTGALACAPLAAQLMAQELSWNEAERQRQVAEFEQELLREFAIQTG